MKKLMVVGGLVLSIGAAFAAGATLSDSVVEAALKKADPDSDGTLDLAEAKKLGISKAVFEKVNPDKDGTLDAKELAAALTMVFEGANPDKDGTLDAKEAKKAGIKAKATFEAADPDKDGTLDINEFVTALTAQVK